MSAGSLRFDGRVAVITGAGRGLGRAHALLLASRGARVVVNDLGGATDGTGERSIGPAEAVVNEIVGFGGEAVADDNSVATSDGGRAMIDRAVEAWGRVDIIVHNAGIASPEPRIDTVSDEQLRRVVDTHLIGAFNVLRPVWRVLERQGYGRIVLISSGQALGDSYNLDYIAAKGGLVSLGRSLAIAGASLGIKANTVMPIAWTRLSALAPDETARAWIESNFPPEDVAHAVAWLSHEDVPVTGETFSVGGGRVARVFFGVAPGYTSATLTPEELNANIDAVMDVSDFVVATPGGNEDAGFYVTSGSGRS